MPWWPWWRHRSAPTRWPWPTDPALWAHLEIVVAGKGETRAYPQGGASSVVSQPAGVSGRAHYGAYSSGSGSVGGSGSGVASGLKRAGGGAVRERPADGGRAGTRDHAAGGQRALGWAGAGTHGGPGSDGAGVRDLWGKHAAGGAAAPGVARAGGGPDLYAPLLERWALPHRHGALG